jgi:hypothetical protein
MDIFDHGFSGRTGPFRIMRETLREVLDREALKGAVLHDVDLALREEGLVLYPVDTPDYSDAKEWVVDKADRAELPLVTEATLRRVAKGVRMLARSKAANR